MISSMRPGGLFRRGRGAHDVRQFVDVHIVGYAVGGQYQSHTRLDVEVPLRHLAQVGRCADGAATPTCRKPPVRPLSRS